MFSFGGLFCFKYVSLSYILPDSLNYLFLIRDIMTLMMMMQQTISIEICANGATEIN